MRPGRKPRTRPESTRKKLAGYRESREMGITPLAWLNSYAGTPITLSGLRFQIADAVGETDDGVPVIDRRPHL